MNINTKATSIFDVKISPNNDKVACALIEAPVKVYSIETGKELLAMRDSNFDSAWSLEWAKENEQEVLLAGYGECGYMRIFDSAGDNLIKYKRKCNDFGYPDAAQLHASGIKKIIANNGYCYSISDNSFLTKFKLAFVRNKFEYVRKHEKKADFHYSKLHDIAFWEEDSLLLSISSWGAVDEARHDVLLLSTETLSESNSKKFSGNKSKILGLAKRNEDSFLSIDEDKNLNVWDINTGQVVQSITLPNRSKKLNVVGNKIYYSIAEKIIVHDLITLAKTKEITLPLTTINSFAISRDEKMLVAGDDEGILHICAL